MDKSTPPNAWNLLATTVVLIVVTVYALISFSTSDPLWFSSKFDAQPGAFSLNCYGAPIEITPGDAQFAPLTATVNQILSGRKNWDQLTMSDITYEEYRTSPKMMVLEMHYPEPVRIHSFYKFFSNLSTIVIPLDGRHASSNAIFGTIAGTPTSGALHYDNIPAIREFIEAQGLCTKP